MFYRTSNNNLAFQARVSIGRWSLLRVVIEPCSWGFYTDRLYCPERLIKGFAFGVGHVFVMTA
jgi:hypothetical protein